MKLMLLALFTALLLFGSSNEVQAATQTTFTGRITFTANWQGFELPDTYPPIPGVDIAIECHSANPTSSSTQHTVTDSNGEFFITFPEGVCVPGSTYYLPRPTNISCEYPSATACNSNPFLAYGSVPGYQIIELGTIQNASYYPIVLMDENYSGSGSTAHDLFARYNYIVPEGGAIIEIAPDTYKIIDGEKEYLILKALNPYYSSPGNPIYQYVAYIGPYYPSSLAETLPLEVPEFSFHTLLFTLVSIPVLYLFMKRRNYYR